MDLATLLSHPAVIAIAPAAVTGGLALAGAKWRLSQLQKDLDAARGEISRKKLRIDELEREGSDSDNPTQRARSYKSALVSTLNDMLDDAAAERGTLYLPVDDADGAFLGLLILCSAPTDLSDKAFHGTLFAGREAHALRAFLDRTVVESRGSAFAFDGYRPGHTYADCLFQRAHGGAAQPVGVVQLLGGATDLDSQRCARAVERFSPKLAEQLAYFRQDTRNRLKLAGLAYPENSHRGSVLMFDITRSSSLFTNEARALLTMSVMEKVMRAGCDAVTSGGGVIENFTGDGFLASFSGQSADDDRPARRALAAAEYMRDAFEDLVKDLRPELGADVNQLLPRSGISTGIVHEIAFSVRQLRAVSIIGRTTSTASLLCGVAPRDRAAVAIDRATYLELTDRDRAAFEAVPQESLPEKVRARRVSVYFDRPPQVLR